MSAKPPREYEIVVSNGTASFSVGPWPYGMPDGVYRYRLVRERREPIAWVVRRNAASHEDGHLYLALVDGMEAWQKPLALASRFDSEDLALSHVRRFGGRVRPLVRRRS